MELEKIMKSKVILFNKASCFINFKNILLKLAYDIYINKQHNLLIDRIEKINKKDLSSNWWYIMRSIFSNIYILDFPNVKEFENNKDNHILNNLKSYEIDKLQYFYLKKICMNKLTKLNILSYKLKLSLIKIIEIYLDLCIKEIFNNKQLNNVKLNEKGKGILLNSYNAIDNLNKKFSYVRFGNKKKTKIHKYLFNHFFKNDILNLKSNKNKKNNDDIITNIISKNNNTIDLFGKRSNSARQKLLYCNSYTRLFIGETDKESILERHLSNILVLKQNNLNVNGSYIDLSEGYLRKIFNKIYQNNSRKLLIDDYLRKTLDKFKVEQKYLNEANKKNTIKTQKKIFLRKFTKLNSDIKNIDYHNKNNFENQILKTYNYNPNKNKFINQPKRKQPTRKMKSAKIRNMFILDNKKYKNIKNESSILIENLCNELSESDIFSKKIKHKKEKKEIWMKTENNITQKNKNFFFRNNNFFNSHNFRNNTYKNTNHFLNTFK